MKAPDACCQAAAEVFNQQFQTDCACLPEVVEYTKWFDKELVDYCEWCSGPLGPTKGWLWALPVRRKALGLIANSSMPPPLMMMMTTTSSASYVFQQS